MDDGKVKLALRYSEGVFLMRYATAQLPEALGDEKFDSKVQATCDDQLRSMRECLRKVSPWSNPPHSRSACFGSPEAWEAAKSIEWRCQKCGDTNTQKNEGWTLKPDFFEKTIEVEFTEDAVYGIWWALFLSAHPRSKSHVSVIELDETVWKVAEKAGWDEALRDKLGISKRPEFLPKRKGNGVHALEQKKEPVEVK